MPKVTGLEGVVAAETEIGHVDGERGHLIYRGYWAKDLAVNHSFEETAYLLWYGALPDARQLAALEERMRAARALPEALRRVLDALPAELPMMGVLQASVATLSGIASAGWPPSAAQAEFLTALLPTVIAYRYRRLRGLPPVEPDPSLDHAANYLYMLTGEMPNSDHAKALTAYLILGMEHGMNASTFAGRVTLSTQSDLFTAVSAAIGTMSGPLHGGAPSEVIAMLEEIGTEENAEPWLRCKLENGGRLMGFGHRIYKTKDPRAEALRIVTERLTGRDHAFEFALHVEKTAIRLLEEYKPGRRLYTNVEFFAAAIMTAIELPAELFTPTFTAARTVGWTAHMLEQSAHNRIFRPLSVYTGPMPAIGD
ncbi:citrate synthase/methylcitrate synthase [Cohnella pontilimi]|uniref:Citrate synthase n=1 Tax=Cohnella pontilimi TaxID=2564100 RepID=A0A4U0FD66_9BACL|nr:citrate synthase/methylcitrate synthase [Cohnella pontilimi]TJY42194.1 citrate synthase/methylcitrate synthase [Cohnella pontilimi]